MAKIETGIFDDQDKLMTAVERVREGGFKLIDCYTPYPVHGLDKAMGLKHSWMGWAAFILAMTGAATGLAMQIGINAWLWPYMIGGKPFNSWPAFIPITFELGVLFCGVGTATVLFAYRRYFPGKAARLAHPDLMRDKFGLAAVSDSRVDELKALLTECGAQEIISTED